VRGALELPGVARVDVTPGKKPFSVTYDPQRITAERILAALKSAREEATVVPGVSATDVEFVRALVRAQEDQPSEPAATARIAPESEPGVPLVVHGRLLDEDGRTPVARAIVFAYHTDQGGRYDRPGAPAHSWRLRGWAETDAGGRFEFRTIRPGAYPSRSEPAHVHLNVFTGRARYSAGALLFEDDPLVRDAERERSRQAGAFGWVRPVRREGSTEHVDLALRLDPKTCF
jgi:protocatechuate 3,4-dioxygenase beta subunit